LPGGTCPPRVKQNGDARAKVSKGKGNLGWKGPSTTPRESGRATKDIAMGLVVKKYAYLGKKVTS